MTEDKIWDIAAGSLLIQNAGGDTKLFSGDYSDPLHCRGAIATNGSLSQPILELLSHSKFKFGSYQECDTQKSLM